jgi:hypothetical protein
MSKEYNPDPWRYTEKFIDRTYASGVAQERPKLVTRIHCEPEPEAIAKEANLSGPLGIAMRDRQAEIEDMRQQDTVPSESCVERFNRALRAGSGWRNEGEDEELT